MNVLLRITIIAAWLFMSFNGHAQIDQSKLGGWYMYAFNTTFKESAWGIQGDFQYRSWNGIDDLEQLLLRSGFTFKPKNADIKFTAGYADITSGAFGDENTTSRESRIYQEALFPVKIGKRFYTNHRFRYEQRFVENQDFRTRYRYCLFLNVPLNKSDFSKHAVYLSFYNEVFINGQRAIGNGATVEMFDRNRLFAGLGYVVMDNLRIQLGLMNQSTDKWRKNQFQLAVLHKI